MVKLHDSIPAINGKFKFNSKINIPSVNIYNALFLYLFLCLCESAFPVVLISSLAMLIPYLTCEPRCTGYCDFGT